MVSGSSPTVCKFLWHIFGPPILKAPEVLGVSVGFHGFHGFSEVAITSNLGGPVGVVGGLGEVSGGFRRYNLQNLAWTFADARKPS